ncbi:MAG: Abi family protein [Campylobacterales bacterium]|nr:Abi family protein [Campylobacterales bacterium]MBD3843131.1 Abi family protein [Campylobacterales bacterium]
MKYHYKKLGITSYLHSLYEDGLNHSADQSEASIEQTILNIGIFRFKGYAKAFLKNLTSYSIDDIIAIHDFDRQLSSNMFFITSSIEIKMKAYLIEIVYSVTDNPFCYLLAKNYKEAFTLPFESIQDWEVFPTNPPKKSEVYFHYRDYYLNTYDFESNQIAYIQSAPMVSINVPKNKDPEIIREFNYPPFHYFVENSTLGTLINIISKLQIDSNDILKLLGKRFGFYTPRLFLNYLLRLKELRNRCAHNGRIFNRNFRGLRAYDKHREFRKTIYEHKILDVYYTLHVLLGNEDDFNTVDDLISRFVSVYMVGLDNKLKDFVLGFVRTR